MITGTDQRFQALFDEKEGTPVWPPFDAHPVVFIAKQSSRVCASDELCLARRRKGSLKEESRGGSVARLASADFFLKTASKKKITITGRSFAGEGSRTGRLLFFSQPIFVFRRDVYASVHVSKGKRGFPLRITAAVIVLRQKDNLSPTHTLSRRDRKRQRQVQRQSEREREREKEKEKERGMEKERDGEGEGESSEKEILL